jgi:lambda repressor-like predicted transcriptional regulator
MIQAGVAPRHVRRMLAELSEHGAQLEFDARQRGLDPVAARAAAREVLGSDEEILARAVATPSLRSWGSRRPVVTMLVAPVVGCCLSGALVLVLAVLFYQVGTSAHLAATDQTRPGPFWYALTTGLIHLAVYLLPLFWSLLVMRYAVSRRLTATPIVWLSVLVLAVIGAVTNLEFVWPDGIRHQASIGAGVGFSTHLAWVTQFAVRCLVVVGLAFAYRQWLVRRTWHAV